MKKILKYIFGIMFLAIIFTSCEKREDIFYRGVVIYTSDNSMYPLDANMTGDIKVSDANVKSLDITIDGNKFKTVNLTDGKASYDFPKADLGLANIDDAVVAKFTAMIDGKPASKNITFKMLNPLTIEGPGDIAPVDTTLYIKYKLASDCTAPTSLVIKQTVNSETPVIVSSVNGNMLDDSVQVVINPSMSGDTISLNFEFVNSNGVVKTDHQLLVIVKRAWDFDDYDSWTTDFAPWTLEDLDGNGVYGISSFDYTGEDEVGSWRIFDFATTDPVEPSGWEAHSGTKYAFCMAAMPSTEHPTNDDWMTSTGFDIEDGYHVSLYAKSITDAYGLERLIVKVIDNATNDETILTDDPYTEVPKDWTNYDWDLSSFAGKNVSIKIGCVSSDAFALFIDDFEILTGSKKSVLSNGFETPSHNITKATKVKN